MKVVIEARALNAAGSGVHTYVQNLIATLLRVAPAHVFSVMDDGPPHEALLPWWLNVTLPRRLKSLEPEVVHFTKAAVPRRVEYPTVVTIYDVIPLLFPESQRWLQRHYWPSALRGAVQRSHHILTISEASKQDIVAWLGADSTRVTVTPLAVDRAQWQRADAVGIARVSATHQIDQPYILYLGRLEPRKNLSLLVRSFARIAADIPHTLVVAGRAYHHAQEIHDEIRKTGLSDERVRIIGFVEAEDLPALVSGADLFVWPSVYEGWAFPVQEAQAVGVPVVVSNGGALPEVVGETGIVVPFTVADIRERVRDAVFEQELAQAMQRVLGNADLQRDLRERGLARVAEFSWEAVARTTVGVYERVYQEAV